MTSRLAPSKLSLLSAPEWIGGALGFALGVGDALLLAALGVEWSLAGRDASLLVSLWFGATCGLLGLLAGRLLRLQRASRLQAETIQRQSDELRESQRAAIQNEKLAAIGRLAAGVAHEVRNPLGIIRSSAAMVQEGFAQGDDAHRACQFICDEIDRLDGLISSLLRFARPVALETQAVAVDGVVERALSLARPAAVGVEIEREPVAAGALLAADPDLMAQVLLDLVTNASEAGARHVVLRATPREKCFDLEVADDGPGVPGEIAERIFEPFFTTKATGTGLGLAMAARIVQAHGGQIQVVPGRGSAPDGGGACFRLTIPNEPLPRAA